MTNELPGHLAAIIERLARLTSSDRNNTDLQPVHWQALRYLVSANRFSQTARALTSYLGLTKGTVSQTLMTLEAKGLVSKRASKSDRRSNQLRITQKGRIILMNDPLEQAIASIAKLPVATQRSLAGGLEELLFERLKEHQRQPFGLCRNCAYFARRHEKGAPHYCQLLKEPLNEHDALAICVEQIASLS